MASAQSDDLDLLWAISADSFPFQSQLMETQVLLHFPVTTTTSFLALLNRHLHIEGPCYCMESSRTALMTSCQGVMF